MNDVNAVHCLLDKDVYWRAPVQGEAHPVQVKDHTEKQEAHGLAHLSDITTADMQMLCNIFPILPSQQ